MQSVRQRKKMIEWPAGAKLYLLALRHPHIVVSFVGAMAGAGISVAFATEKRWQKLLISTCCGVIFSNGWFATSGDDPSLAKLCATASLIAMVSWIILEFVYSKKNQEKTL